MKSKTQIVATLGPASGSQKTLNAMAKNGMDVVRLNFSWGTHEEHGGYIKRARLAAKTAGKRIPIIQDLSGPREKMGGGHGFNKRSTSVITPKDRADLAFGLSMKVEYIALSYVGGKRDVIELRGLIKQAKGRAKIIAKIERAKALRNLSAIVAEADAVMVARGDLGREVPLEKIPFIEKKIIALCNKAKKPVITATQMLTSMIKNKIPSRADITDIEFAVLAGTDAVMLSEETTIGAYPAQTVRMMDLALIEAEKHSSHRTRPL